MFKKCMNYLKGIREAEKLEARSIKVWKEEGTTEEAIKVLKMQKDKKRNNMIGGLVYAAAWAGVMYYINRKEKQAVEETRITDVEVAHVLALEENYQREFGEVEAAASVEE